MADGSENIEDISPPGQTAGKNARAVDQLGAVDNRILDELSPSQKQQLGRQLADSSDSDASVRLVKELDASEVRYLLEADDLVMTSRLGQMRDRGTIGTDDVNRVARGLDEGTIDSAAVREGIVRTERLNNRGHEVIELKTARQANDNFDRSPPHKEGTMVIEYEAQSSDRFVRIHDSPDDPGGEWIMKESEFSDLSSRDDVMDRFALKEEWGDYDRVAEITIGDGPNEGVRVEMSTAGTMDDGIAGTTRPGGGTQHRLVDEGQNWEDVGELNTFLENT